MEIAAELGQNQLPSGQAPDQSNDAIEPLLQRAKGLLQRGQAQECGRVLGQALRINPFHVPSLELLGRVYMGLSDFAQAVEVHRRLLALNREDPRAYNALAISLIMCEDLDTAQQLLETAVKLAPEDRTYLANLGKLWMMRGEWARAQAYLVQALDQADAPYRADLTGMLEQCHQKLLEEIF